jgi:hypothetical protein
MQTYTENLIIYENKFFILFRPIGTGRGWGLVDEENIFKLGHNNVFAVFGAF